MSRRSEKVASLLKEVVSEIIIHNLKDPVFKQFISITDVKIGEDLKKATFYFRVYQGDEKQIETALNKAKGYIKKLIAEKIVIMSKTSFAKSSSKELSSPLLIIRTSTALASHIENISSAPNLNNLS